MIKARDERLRDVDDNNVTLITMTLALINKVKFYQQSNAALYKGKHFTCRLSYLVCV